MHQNRRRKKRPSYGIRTVEITRSRSGFGFTISGQAPCILSCIVSCSPAEQVGLRPGDYLIAVNGQNVSKAPHDDVVRLIGNSSGILKLQIAENYYSDSSEDEIMAVSRSKLKYPNRVRSKQHHVHRAERVVQDLQAGLLFERGRHVTNQLLETNTKKNNRDFKNGDAQLVLCTNTSDKRSALQQRLKERTGVLPLNVCHDNLSVNIKHHSKKRERKPNNAPLQNEQNSSSGKENLCNRFFIEQELNDVLYPSLQPSSWDVYLEEALYRAVVGYLGTIEMPKEPQIPGTRLQAVRKCIRRLLVEKKVHTLVLLTVFIEKITLTNPHGLMIAEYPAEKISFSGVYADDKKFFGLVTSQRMTIEDGIEENHGEPVSISNSCHVFMIDPRMISHEAHANRAKMFSLECGHDPRFKCREFPESADPILRAILSVYRNRGDGHVDFASGLVDVDAAIIPQHSNTSSNSSNSDSGIGFRDDAHHSDQVFVVDVNDIPQRVPFSNINSGPQLLPCAAQHNKDERNLHAVKDSATASIACDFNQTNKLDRLTVRVMPNPVGYPTQDMNSNERKSCPKNHSKSAKIVDCADSDEFSRPLSLPPSVLNIHRVTPVGCSLTATIPTELHLHKLSPKVYNVDFPATPSVLLCHSPLPVVEGLPSSLICDVDSQDALTDATENTGEQEGSQDVHPPTQDEESECSELDHISHVPEATKRWMRTSSLRRELCKRGSPHVSNESGAMSDGELVSGKLSTCSSMLGFDGVSMEGSVQDGVSGASGSSAYGSERNCSHNRVASWAISFEKLLNDPAGVHTLAEFLKKEFSHENIYFWVACERYRNYVTEHEMKEKACELFKRHLCLGAPEPVNVDSHARQLAQEGLYNPSRDIFVQAQKQIYNLMKFDCYNRFLKSPLYKECVMAELSGTSLPLMGDDKLDPGIPYGKDVKCKPKTSGKDDTEEHRRKSLLPWHRRSSKSKDGKGLVKSSELRKSYRQIAKDQRDDASDVSESRMSLASSDLVSMQRQAATRESVSTGDTFKFSANCVKSGPTLCRVILPDQSTTVVQTKTGDSVYAILQGLLEKRGLQYSAIEVFIANSGQAVEMSEDSSVLGCCEVLVEQRVVFCLDLQCHKTIAVRARPTMPLSHVLIPILQRYEINIEDIIIHQVGLEKSADLCALAASVDKQYLVVQSREEYAEWGRPDNRCRQVMSRGTQPTRTRCLSVSDETAAQAWTDSLLGKSLVCFDDLGVFDLDLVKPSTKAVIWQHMLVFGERSCIE